MTQPIDLGAFNSPKDLPQEIVQRIQFYTWSHRTTGKLMFSSNSPLIVDMLVQTAKDFGYDPTPAFIKAVARRYVSSVFKNYETQVKSLHAIHTNTQ